MEQFWDSVWSCYKKEEKCPLTKRKSIVCITFQLWFGLWSRNWLEIKIFWHSNVKNDSENYYLQKSLVVVIMYITTKWKKNNNLESKMTPFKINIHFLKVLFFTLLHFKFPVNFQYWWEFENLSSKQSLFLILNLAKRDLLRP